ncbi:hypothetical protein [Sorangium sp. So ce204]|uniref:hypothetical protein n=1 Tax=Sorangium sp. So ce204 TaxID=3133288 RepID=UPI003F5DC529
MIASWAAAGDDNLQRYLDTVVTPEWVLKIATSPKLGQTSISCRQALAQSVARDDWQRPRVQLGQAISVAKTAEGRLGFEEGTLGACVRYGGKFFIVSNAHVFGAGSGLDDSEGSLAVVSGETIVAWTRQYSRITRKGGNLYDVGLAQLVPGTKVEAHPLVRGPVRDLDQEPLEKGEVLSMWTGRGLVCGTFDFVDERRQCSFGGNLYARFVNVAVLKSPNPVSVAGESGGIWVDSQGRPVLLNNYGSEEAGADGWTGGGLPLCCTVGSTMEWLRRTLGDGVTLSFDALDVPESDEEAAEGAFDYRRHALTELDAALKGAKPPKPDAALERALDEHYQQGAKDIREKHTVVELTHLAPRLRAQMMQVRYDHQERIEAAKAKPAATASAAWQQPDHEFGGSQQAGHRHVDFDSWDEVEEHGGGFVGHTNAGDFDSWEEAENPVGGSVGHTNAGDSDSWEEAENTVGGSVGQGNPENLDVDWPW